MNESMKVRYGYINPGANGGKYISDTTLIPVDSECYGDLMDLHMIPYMIPNSDSVEEMLEIIESGNVYISWDATGDGVFGMFKTNVIYAAESLELRIYREYLNSL